jgi:hypothetical protein
MVARVIAKEPHPDCRPQEARQSKNHERGAPGTEREKRGNKRRRQRVTDPAGGMHDALREAPISRRSTATRAMASWIGKAAPSPKPTARRIATSDVRPPAAPVKAVETATMTQQAVKTSQAPNLSAIQPPMSWNRAYGKAKAENASPSFVLSRWRSRAMSGAAVEMFTRSTKRMKYIRHSSRRTARGGVSQVRGMGGRSGSGRCFAFHLGAVHDAA